MWAQSAQYKNNKVNKIYAMNLTNYIQGSFKVFESLGGR